MEESPFEFPTDDQLLKEYRKRTNPKIIQNISKDEKDKYAEWSIEKEFKHSYRISKDKTTQEKVPDDVWCLFKEFGIKQLSVNALTFDIPDSGQKFALDLLAVDEEFIFAVRCLAIPSLGTFEEIENEVKNFHNLHEFLRNSIKKLLGRSGKVTFMLATENITWSEDQRRLAKENKITVLDEYDIDKLRELSKLAGQAAKYQLYSRLFQDSKIKSYGMRLAAIECKMGGQHCYLFSMAPEDLLKITYIHQRAAECSFLELSDSYQRMLKKSRVNKIRQYIDGGGFFPGAIILNFKKKIAKIGPLGKKTERDEIDKASNPVIIELPPYYGSAWIIDGQHRLYGFADTPRKKTETLSVVAFEKLSMSDQARIFLDINQYQSAISSDLKWDLYEDLFYDSSVEKERQLYAISRIGKTLNERGALKDKIRIPKDEITNPYAHIGLESICKSIQVNKFIAVPSGPYYNADVQKSISNCSEALNKFFTMIADDLPSEWKQDTRHFICTTSGVAVLLNIFRDLLDSLTKYWDDEKSLLERIRPFVTTLTQYIRTLNADKIREYREASVGRAQTSIAQDELTAAIVKRTSYYSSYLNKREPLRWKGEFASYAYLEESERFEAKGSFRLDVDRFLSGDGKKVLDNNLALMGVLKSIVGLLNAEQYDAHSDIVVGLLEKGRFAKASLKAFGDRYLLFGIDDEYDNEAWDGYERTLLNFISDHIANDAFNFLVINKINVDGKDFCIIRVPRGDRKPLKWYYLDKKCFYVRIGGQTKELSGQDADSYKKTYPGRG